MKERCWLPYLEKCKLCLQDLEYVLYAADMLPRFYQIISREKEKFKILANHKLEKEKFLYEFSASNTASLHKIF